MRLSGYAGPVVYLDGDRLRRARAVHALGSHREVARRFDVRHALGKPADRRGKGISARHAAKRTHLAPIDRSEEHTSELQSLMRISYAVFCLKKKKQYKKSR